MNLTVSPQQDQISKDKGRKRYYRVTDAGAKYISDTELIRKLAQKRYDQQIYRQAKLEQQCLEKLIRSYPEETFEEVVSSLTEDRGERVRSKSEKIIADALAMNGIPYKYECPLKVGRNLIHPDFTILRKSDLKVFYWEHCGKSDDPDYYSKNIVKRTGIYAEGGIAVGKGLFMTFESSKVPLDSRVVETIINDLK